MYLILACKLILCVHVNKKLQFFVWGFAAFHEVSVYPKKELPFFILFTAGLCSFTALLALLTHQYPEPMGVVAKSVCTQNTILLIIEEMFQVLCQTKSDILKQVDLYILCICLSLRTVCMCVCPYVTDPSICTQILGMESITVGQIMELQYSEVHTKNM